MPESEKLIIINSHKVSFPIPLYWQLMRHINAETKSFCKINTILVLLWDGSGNIGPTTPPIPSHEKHLVVCWTFWEVVVSCCCCYDDNRIDVITSACGRHAFSVLA